MKIALVSTFGIKCGIAQYTRELVEALKLQGLNPTIIANIPSNKNIQDHQVFPDDGFNVHRCWSVEGWSNEIKAPDITEVFDVYHVQYESFLYGDTWFPSWVRSLMLRGAKFIITYHSSGRSPLHPVDCFDLGICHNKETYNSIQTKFKMLMELPCQYRKPKIATFGLGRSNVEWITQACNELGYEFVNLIRATGDNWTSIDGLIDDLRACDAIVLPYHPVGAYVSSSAVKTALATYRPVIVSKTSWFSSLSSDYVYKHDYDYASFKTTLEYVIGHRQKFLKSISWEVAAKKHHEWYQAATNL